MSHVHVDQVVNISNVMEGFNNLISHQYVFEIVFKSFYELFQLAYPHREACNQQVCFS